MARPRRPFCADLSRSRGESLAGTASRVDHWLVVEYHGMWARDPLGGSRIPESVKAHLRAQLASLPRSRLLFVRRPHERVGASVDFAEHRGYTPGDDIRRVDWKLYGRTDRFYIKEYEADTNANFAVLLDVSKSMGFGSRGITKLEYGQLLAGCLTYMVHRQRDRVGFAAFDDDVVEFVPPSAKHMAVTLHVLDRLEPRRAGQLATPLKKLAELFSRRGLLVLVSDFYEDPQAVLE